MPFVAFYLKNDLAKHHHKWLRSRLLLVVSRLIKDTQCGGVQKRGTDIAASIVKLFKAYACEIRVDTANLFLDIRSAYYSTIRQFLLSLPREPDDLEIFGLVTTSIGAQ